MYGCDDDDDDDDDDDETQSLYSEESQTFTHFVDIVSLCY